MPQRAWVRPLGALWTVKSDARQVITAYDTQANAIAAARALLGAAAEVNSSLVTLTATSSTMSQWNGARCDGGGVALRANGRPRD